MFKPSDCRRPGARLPGAGPLAAAVLLTVLVVPLTAAAGIASSDSRNTPSVPGLPKAVRGTGNMQISCWQYGRLLFEESYVTLPGDGSQPAVKINATDRNGRPLYIAETQNATCLIRGVGEASSR
jgi:hypothetical protein